MAFESYEIPGAIGVPRIDSSMIDLFASSVGETPEQYMLGSIGLVAIWGEMISEVNFAPGFLHGLGNPVTEDLELFNIDDLIAIVKPQVKERELISAEIGFEMHPEDILVFEIPEILHPRIRNACVYFGHGPKALIGAATEIRRLILSGQDDGLIYVFSIDGENWYDVEIDTITGDTGELIGFEEVNGED